MKPTMGSLFAGIGGFDLGFERAGFQTVWQVEINDYCRKVLAKHFPHAERFEDIRECGRNNLKPVDVICGGFPCQDISNAGKRAGIDGERSGLWSEMHRIIGELRPRFVVVENVAALLGRGIPRVLGDLAEVGYDAEWQVISAADVGAPHLRERIWIVAYSDQRCVHRGETYAGNGRTIQAEGLKREFCGSGCGEDVAYAERARLPQRVMFSGIRGEEECGDEGQASFVGGEIPDTTGRRGQSSGTQCDEWRFQNEAVRSLGHSHNWETEPDVGRVANGIPARVDRLRGLGNAVVPQIPELIARRLLVHFQKVSPYSVMGAEMIDPQQRNRVNQ